MNIPAPFPAFCLLALCFFPLGACRHAESQSLKPVRYLCDGGARLAAVYDLDAHRIHLTFGAIELDLDQTRSADGARFSDGLTTFWDHGPSASLQLAASPSGITCHIQE